MRTVTATATGGAARHSSSVVTDDERSPWKLLLKMLPVLAAIGAALGLYAKDLHQALNLVARVLLGIALVLFLLAFVQLVRRRRALAALAAVNPERVDTVVDVPAAAHDAVEIGPVEVTAAGEVEPDLGAHREPRPAAARAAVSPEPDHLTASGRVATAMDVAPLEARADVLDAIAPYAEVVGQPVFYEDHAPAATTAPTPRAPARPASSVPPPPPPPPPAGRIVPPPPPAPASPSVVAPPAPVAPRAPVAPVGPVTPVASAAVPTPPTAPAVPAPPPSPVPHVAAEHQVAVQPEPVDGPMAEAIVSELVLPDVGDALLPSDQVPGWSRSSAFPAARGAAMPLASGASAEMAARSAVGSVAPVIVYRYRKWVLGQMVPGAPFEPVAVDRTPDEWLLLSTCGVATLMAWTHEDHHFTYPVETWADEILPAHGVRIRDRQLAVDLLLAAALHAGGIDAVPSDRLRSYQAGDLVTAMASIHVGLLRLYCGLGRIGPERVLADQYGIGPGDIPLH